MLIMLNSAFKDSVLIHSDAYRQNQRKPDFFIVLSTILADEYEYSGKTRQIYSVV